MTIAINQSLSFSLSQMAKLWLNVFQDKSDMQQMS
jgi:hypothetical protein